MGGEPYWYVVPYEADIDAALQKLRHRELNAGRYNPVMPFLSFPVDPAVPGPGGQHATFDDAMTDADADGTRSIIDLARASKVPYDGSGDPSMTAWPIRDDEIARMTGSRCPTVQMLVECEDLWESIERGSGVYVVVYEGATPSEIFFAGYSFD